MELVLIYSDTQSFEPLQSVLPVSLISIMGKPLIQHQLELSYSQGIRHCTIIASNNLAKIRSFCADGKRFGVKLNLVTAAQSGDETASLLRHRNLLGDHVLILAGRTFANLPIEQLKSIHEQSGKQISVIRHKSSQKFVGVLTSPPSPGDFFEGLSGDLEHSAEQMITRYNDQTNDQINVIDMEFPHVVCRTLQDVLHLTATVLDTPADYINNTHFTQQEKGVYLGHHTMVHPTAKIHPPVAVGDFCQIMEDAEIGPHTTISSGSIIAQNAKVKNAIVSPDSYVGEMMEVKDSIVVGATLVQPKTKTKVLVSDPLLLDNLHGHSLPYLFNAVLHRTTALGLLAALAPAGMSVAILSKLRTNRAISRTPTLGHNDVEDKNDIGWLPRFNRLKISDESLPLRWYPTLYNILKGQMRFIGPSPVSTNDANTDDTISNTERFKVPPGLLSVADLFEPDSEEAIFAEMLYSKKSGIFQDLRCIAANLSAEILGKRIAKRISGL